MKPRNFHKPRSFQFGLEAESRLENNDSIIPLSPFCPFQNLDEYILDGEDLIIIMFSSPHSGRIQLKLYIMDLFWNGESPFQFLNEDN